MKMEFDHKIIREILDSDPEFKAEVKGKILATALSKEVALKTDQAMKDSMDKQVRLMLGELGFDMSGYRIALSDNLADKINEIVRDVITREASWATDYFEEQLMVKIREYAASRVAEIEKKYDSMLRELIDKRTETYINNAVNAKIERIIGNIKKLKD